MWLCRGIGLPNRLEEERALSMYLFKVDYIPQDNLSNSIQIIVESC